MGKPAPTKCFGFPIIIFIVLLSLLSQESVAEDVYDEEVMRQKVAEQAREHGLDPSTSQVMMPPTVTDEERGSHHMPVRLRCSGCWAVAYQFDLAFKKAMKKVKSGSRLPLVDQIDVAETVCEKNLHGYGLKQVQGKKFLSGPGLGADTFPGVMEAGGKWEARLKVMCMEVVEEFEEEGIYDAWEESGDFKKLAAEICGYYCGGKHENEDLNSQAGSKKEEL